MPSRRRSRIVPLFTLAFIAFCSLIFADELGFATLQRSLDVHPAQTRTIGLPIDDPTSMFPMRLLGPSTLGSTEYAAFVGASIASVSVAAALVSSRTLSWRKADSKDGCDLTGQAKLEFCLDTAKEQVTGLKDKVGSLTSERDVALEKAVASEIASRKAKSEASSLRDKTTAAEKDRAEMAAKLDASEARREVMSKTLKGIRKSVTAALDEPTDDSAEKLDDALSKIAASEQLVAQKEQEKTEADARAAELQRQLMELSSVKGELDAATVLSTRYMEVLEKVDKFLMKEEDAGLFSIFQSKKTEDEMITEILQKIDTATTEKK